MLKNSEEIPTYNETREKLAIPSIIEENLPYVIESLQKQGRGKDHEVFLFVCLFLR